MGSQRYLSTLALVDAVVGNSSSGLIEAPAFKIATVNIGDRQRGRLCADSVMHCEVEVEAIRLALAKVFSGELAVRLKNVANPYGQGGASSKIKKVLKQTPLTDLLKKRFYDFAQFKVGS
jgi:UDP-N-acetylglucosamine 2-epimerase